MDDCTIVVRVCAIRLRSGSWSVMVVGFDGVEKNELDVMEEKEQEEQEQWEKEFTNGLELDLSVLPYVTRKFFAGRQSTEYRSNRRMVAIEKSEPSIREQRLFERERENNNDRMTCRKQRQYFY